MFKQVSVWLYLSFLVGLYQGVELLGHEITVFTLLRKCRTVFQSGCTIVHFHQQRMRVPVSPLSVVVVVVVVLIYLFLAVLGLHCCTRAFSSCGEQGLLIIAVSGLLIAVASLVVEHGL